MLVYAGSVGTPKKGPASVSGQGEGIYTLEIHDDLSMKVIDVLPADNAGIICMDPEGKYVYAANETKDFTGLNGSGGGVTACRIDPGNGKLTRINDNISYGSRTSYVTVSDDGRYLLASNHGSHSTVTCHYVQDDDGKWVLQRGFDDSNTAAFRMREDGGIGELTDLKLSEGHGYWCHGGGQSTSHNHCVKTKGDLVFVCNRGADRIEVMRLDGETGKLTVLNRFCTRRGYAPRHAALHPEKDILYVLNENYPALSVYRFDRKSGEMEDAGLTGTAPADYYKDRPLPVFEKPEADEKEKNTSAMGDRTAFMPADIHISKDGRFLAASNRCFSGHGMITMFRVDPDGMPEPVYHQELPGKDPRGFQLIMQDKYLIAGLLDRNLVQLYRVNADLTLTFINETTVPSPASFVQGKE